MSIWSKIGKGLLFGGAAALAPFTGGASLGATLGAFGAGAGGSILSDAFSRKSKPADPSSPSYTGNANIDALVKQTTDTSSSLARLGLEDRTKASESLDPATKYYLDLIHGDRSSIAEATAPTNATILGQYDTARRAVANESGRSGSKGEKIAESYFSQASDMTRSLEGARSDAAKQLAAMGIDLDKLGLTEEELSQSGLLDIIRSMTAANTAKRGQNLETGSALGAGIGKIISGFLFKGNKDKGGGGGGLGGSNLTSGGLWDSIVKTAGGVDA